jgi:hypothetical protein
MMHVSNAVRQFNTLREVVDITQKLDFSEFKFVKRLGHGAFGEVSEYQVRNDVSTRVVIRALDAPSRTVRGRLPLTGIHRTRVRFYNARHTAPTRELVPARATKSNEGRKFKKGYSVSDIQCWTPN